MNRQDIVKAVTRLSPEGDRIGLDAILQHIEREAKTARQANVNGIKLHHGRPAAGDAQSNDTDLVVVLMKVVELTGNLQEFLTAVIEERKPVFTPRQEL